MTYDSPKQIRRRQQRQNDAPRRIKRTHEIRLLTDEEWEEICNLKLACLNYWIDENRPESAGRHAQSLVAMAVRERANQIRRDHGRGLDMATWMAREQLFNGEAA